jgi:hypothetical protein
MTAFVFGSFFNVNTTDKKTLTVLIFLSKSMITNNITTCEEVVTLGAI